MTKYAAMLVAAFAVASALAARPAQAADPWGIDPAHSSIVFNITHNNGAGLVYGRFDKFTGTIMADADHPENSSVEVHVDSSSVDTAVPMRDKDLQSDKYFNAAKFTELSFKSTSVSAVDGQPGTFTVSGDFTLLGVTKPLTFTIKQHPVVTNKKGQMITGFDTAFVLKRSDFGMTTGIPMMGDDVNVMIAFECDKVMPTDPAQAAPAKTS